MFAAAIVLAGLAAGIAVLGLAVIIAGLARNWQVSQAVHAHAVRHGWTYASTMPDLVDRWPGIEALTDEPTHPRSIVSGTFRGVPFVSATLVPGRSGHPADALRHISGTGVVALATPATLPTVVLRPRNFSEALFGSDASREIRLGIHDFDATWSVSGDEDTVAALLTQDVQQWLMEEENMCPYGFAGGDVLTWSVERISPERIEAYVEQLEELLTILPDTLWHR